MPCSAASSVTPGITVGTELMQQCGRGGIPEIDGMIVGLALLGGFPQTAGELQIQRLRSIQPSRLDVDPWQEAAELSELPTDTATQRLVSLLARLPGGRWAQADSWAIG